MAPERRISTRRAVAFVNPAFNPQGRQTPLPFPHLTVTPEEGESDLKSSSGAFGYLQVGDDVGGVFNNELKDDAAGYIQTVSSDEVYE